MRYPPHSKPHDHSNGPGVGANQEPRDLILGIVGSGVALCVAGIVFTVIAQGAVVEELDRQFGEITGDAPTDGVPAAAADVAVSSCEVVDDGFGFLSTQATIRITNGTDTTQSYLVTVSVNDQSGARVGEINAVSNSLAAGQSVTLSGVEASGVVSANASPGPAECSVASVDRFPS